MAKHLITTVHGLDAAFGRYDATIRATGVAVSTPYAHYFKFREGKLADTSTTSIPARSSRP